MYQLQLKLVNLSLSLAGCWLLWCQEATDQTLVVHGKRRLLLTLDNVHSNAGIRGSCWKGCLVFVPLTELLLYSVESCLTFDKHADKGWHVPLIICLMIQLKAAFLYNVQVLKEMSTHKTANYIVALI